MQIELLRPELREKIISSLKQHDGLTITYISKLLDIHPSTASKYLAVMEVERSVICKHIGMAKVYRPAPCNDAKRLSTQNDAQSASTQTASINSKETLL